MKRSLGGVGSLPAPRFDENEIGQVTRLLALQTSEPDDPLGIPWKNNGYHKRPLPGGSARISCAFELGVALL